MYTKNPQAVSLVRDGYLHVASEAVGPMEYARLSGHSICETDHRMQIVFPH
jgi:hypothetical protein